MFTPKLAPLLAAAGLALAVVLPLPHGGSAAVQVRQSADQPGACSDDPPAVAARVRAFAATLNRAQRVGQLFMVGLSSGAGTSERALVDDDLTRLYAGNVVLYGNGWNGAAAIRAVARSLQSEAKAADGGAGLFISGNQEGGQQGAFQAFYGQGFQLMPSAVVQGQTDPSLLYQEARGWAIDLKGAGINLDLAPVLDTVPAGTEQSNDPIGYWNRQLGSDPASVSEHGLAIVRGMRDAGIAVSPKHFPGLGRVTGNTDFTASGTADPYFSGAGDPFLQPYADAVNAGADFMMVSSAIYPQVDDQRAMFSSVIVTGLLRDYLGFPGVVISDDVGAAAAVADLTPAQRALAFFQAGGDMVLTVQPSDIEPMITATQAAMDADPTFAQQIEGSVLRVLTAKDRVGQLPTSC